MKRVIQSKRFSSSKMMYSALKDRGLSTPMEIRGHRAKAPLLGPTRLQDPTRLYGVVTALDTGALRVVWSTYTAGGGTVGAGLSWTLSGASSWAVAASCARRISTVGRRSMIISWKMGGKTSASMSRQRGYTTPPGPGTTCGCAAAAARQGLALAASYSGFAGASFVGDGGGGTASSTALMWGRRAALRPWRMRWHAAGEQRPLSLGYGASMCSNSFWAWSAAAAGFAGGSRAPSAKRKRT